MAVVPLNDQVDNIPQFLDSLFSVPADEPDSPRCSQNVKDAAAAGSDTHSFIDHRSRKIILESWLAAWKTYGKDVPGEYAQYIRPLDQNIINFLAWYIESNHLQFCKPRITFSSTSFGPDEEIGVPFYTNAGYTREAFKDKDGWSYGTFSDSGKPNNDGTVARFLWYLFHGAHFVVIDLEEDQADNVPDFKSTFTSRVTHSTCPGHSHYATSYPILGQLPNIATSYYYLDIGDAAPTANPSYIVALLAGDTSLGDTNGFMQLEGWQGQGGTLKGGPRHEADYDTHLDTRWNISTYGACAYSEKRSTPIFLAQASFPLSIDRLTHMPLYDGAGSVQHWMKPGYLTGGRIDEVLKDVHDNIGHFYFFQGTQVVHYDTSKKQMHGGYPMKIEKIFPGLADAGIDTVDAAFAKPGTSGDKGTYYFFKGSKRVHYDAANKKILSTGSINDFAGITFKKLDAAVYVQGHGDSIYFFSGEQFQRFNVTKNEADGGAQSIVDGFGLAGLDGFTTVDAVESWNLQPPDAHDLRLYANKLLLFHNDQIAFYDPDLKTLSPYDGIQHIYGKHIFPGLWWA
jgi:Hemopexin